MKNHIFRIKKYISHIRIDKNGLFAAIVFSVTRIVYRVMRSKKRRLDFYEDEVSIVLLTPLSGSSSIRKVKKCNRAVKYAGSNSKKLYVICRDESKRLESFYNKKILASETLGKVAFLATCLPFDFHSSREKFYMDLQIHLEAGDADKHLVPIDSLAQGFFGDEVEVEKLNLVSDMNKILEILGIEELPVEKSTKEIVGK